MIYLRDAQGNVMAVFEHTIEESAAHLKLKEQHIYGSSRLGMKNCDREMIGAQVVSDIGTFALVRGEKSYELSNHLGNVLEVITDQKLAISDGGSGIDHFLAEVISYTDYYPFGAPMDNGSASSDRNWQGDFRYSFQGQENDKELYENEISFKYRIEDTRLGRFLTLDPMLYRFPEYSTYAFSGNRVVDAFEILGLQPRKAIRRQSIRTSRDFSGTSFLSTIVGLDYQGKYFRNNLRLKHTDPSSIGEVDPPVPGEEIFYPIPFKTGTLQVPREEGIKSLSTPAIIDPNKEVTKDNEDSFDSDDAPHNNHVPLPSIDIHFKGADDEIINKDQAKTEIIRLAKYLMDNPNVNITIIGNTGGDQSIPEGHSPSTLKQPNSKNKIEFPTIRDLMLGRARAVRKILMNDFGIDPNRIWVAPGNHSHKETGRKTTVIQRD